jgi:hypothetical protein
MGKKKSVDQNTKEKVLYDFGFGEVDIENSDFPTLARAMGLDPKETFDFLDKHTKQLTHSKVEKLSKNK